MSVRTREGGAGLISLKRYVWFIFLVAIGMLVGSLLTIDRMLLIRRLADLEAWSELAPDDAHVLRLQTLVIEVDRVVRIVVAATIVRVPVLIGLFYFLWRRVLSPLTASARVFERYRQGDRAARIPTGRVAEMWAFSEGFNALADDVERLVAELEDSRAVLEQANRDLERSNRDLEQFAYVASHDLAEPLRMVASYVGAIEDRYKGRLDEDADTYIHFAVDGANRMQAMIDDLLQYSRAGRMSEPAERLSIAEVVTDALVGQKTAIDEAGAVVEVDTVDVEVMGWPSLLAQVFSNLVGNAVKFRHTERAPVVSVRWVVDTAEDRLIVRVADNGIGIPERFRDRVFQMFQRLHGRGSYEGNGIGLALCSRIVHAHGGEIWIDSDESAEGTVFAFSLPLPEAVSA